MKFMAVILLIVASVTLNSQVFESKKDLIEDDKTNFESEISIGLLGSLNFNTHEGVVAYNYVDLFDANSSQRQTDSSLYNSRSDNETYNYGLAFQYKIKDDDGYIFSITSRLQIDDKSFLNREAVVRFQDIQDPDDEASALYTKEYEISYLGFDVTYDYYFLGSGLTLSAGPAFRFLLDGKMNENYDFAPGLSENELELLNTNGTTDISNNMNSILFGLRFNLGYAVNIGDIKLRVTGGINTYFNDVWNDTNWSVSDVFSALEIYYTL